jgi:hypothetical protein
MIDLDRTVVHFKKMGPRRRTYGRAYHGIPGMANLDGLAQSEWDYLVVVAQHEQWFKTLAHEAKHIEQFKRGIRASEREAYLFADHADERRS